MKKFEELSNHEEIEDFIYADLEENSVLNCKFYLLIMYRALVIDQNTQIFRLCTKIIHDEASSVLKSLAILC